MGHKITFYPEGNADTCLVEPENGEMLLFDYADRHGDDEVAKLRVDLSAALEESWRRSAATGSTLWPSPTWTTITSMGPRSSSICGMP